MNYLFISPNYPGGHWRYAASLRQAGHNVYAIGDAGSETFPAELRGNLNDYYRVGDLHNYEEVYMGCCYFVSRYGRFDEVDSLNPYWCDLVAAVRHDFILNRTCPEEQYAILRTAQMCEEPEQRTFAAGDADQAAELAAALGGYPVFLFPSTNKRLGVRRVGDEEELRQTIDSAEEENWQIRRCAEGEPLSVDCLCCCRVEPELGVSELVPVVWGIHVFGKDGCVWSLPVTDNALAQLSENVLPAFFADRSGMVFFHADCVKLKKAVAGLGKKGDIILNEWWQTPPHELIIDCINIEYDCDVRGMWAANIMPNTMPEQIYSAGIASRSFERSYRNPHEKVMRRLAGKLRIHDRTGGFDTGTFLDYHYIFSGADTAEIKRGIKFITEDHIQNIVKPDEDAKPDKSEKKTADTVIAGDENNPCRKDSYSAKFEAALKELELSTLENNAAPETAPDASDAPEDTASGESAIDPVEDCAPDLAESDNVKRENKENKKENKKKVKNADN